MQLHADGWSGGCTPDCGMEIGNNITYKGKCYVLRGLDPMSVPDRRAELEDPESGEFLSVPFAGLDAASEPRGLSAEA